MTIYNREYLRQNLSESILKRFKTQNQKRLLDAALSASDDQISNATEHYKVLSRRANSFADTVGIAKPAVSAMLAVLHTRKSGWDTTFSNLEQLIDRAILLGEDVNLAGGVTNKQVRLAFDCYRNIKESNDIDKVVVDLLRRHLAHSVNYDLEVRPIPVTLGVYKIWSGGDTATTTLNGSLYAKVGNDATFVALSMGIQPCELQALLDQIQAA